MKAVAGSVIVLAGAALFCFITAVLVGGQSMAFPPVAAFKAV